MPVFIVLSSWQCHCKSSPSSCDKCSKRHVAADLWTKPISLSWGRSAVPSNAMQRIQQTQRKSRRSFYPCVLVVAFVAYFSCISCVQKVMQALSSVHSVGSKLGLGYVHIDTSMSPGFHLWVVCHSYKLHPHEWSVVHAHDSTRVYWRSPVKSNQVNALQKK